MELYKLIVPVIGLALLAASLRSYVKSQSTLFEMIFWAIFWSFVVSLSLFPDTITDFVAKSLGIKSNVNAIIFTGLGVLFFMQFNLFFIIKKQNRVITGLIRKIALDKENRAEDKKENYSEKNHQSEQKEKG